MNLKNHFSSRKFDRAHVPDDLFGDAYEYLIRTFASKAGQSSGEFYTPKEISYLMSEIIEPAEGWEAWFRLSMLSTDRQFHSLLRVWRFLSFLPLVDGAAKAIRLRSGLQNVCAIGNPIQRSRRMPVRAPPERPVVWHGEMRSGMPRR